MDPMEEFVRDAPIWKGMEADAERPNAIGLPTSYLHHFTPIKFTTEIKLLAKEIESRQLMGLIPWALDNVLVSPLAGVELTRSIALPAQLAKLGEGIEALPEVVSGEVSKVNKGAIEVDHLVEIAWEIESSGTEEVVDLVKTLQSMPIAVHGNAFNPLTQSWLDTAGVNPSPIAIVPKGAPLRLLFQQLVEAARHEAKEMQAALARFQEGLERLAFGPPQAAPVLAKGAVRARGVISGPASKEAETIEVTILTEAWETGEELELKVERGPEIHRGKLKLSLLAPAELGGRTANIVLSTEEMEVLLRSATIKDIGKGRARIALDLDLESMGIKVEDGLLPLTAFKVFIEPRKSRRGGISG